MDSAHRERNRQTGLLREKIERFRPLQCVKTFSPKGVFFSLSQMSSEQGQGGVGNLCSQLVYRSINVSPRFGILSSTESCCRIFYHIVHE